MKLFSCDECGQQLYFESTSCTRCGCRLGYDAERSALRVLSEKQGQAPELVDSQGGQRRVLRSCLNAVEHDACNWLVPQPSDSEYCASCALSQTIPDLSVDANVVAWKRLESAKRRLLFTLQALQLPVVPKSVAPDTGLAFRFLRGTLEEPVTTGHEDGLITLDVAEADPAYREQQRQKLGEKYRTTLGHLRHEIGHYYFDRLIADGGRTAPFRKLFGDESADYGEALERHYKQGPPSDWEQTHISAYATMHPWEDWAETFAHYLHMVDTLETAQSYGLAVRPPDASSGAVRASAVDVNEFASLMEGFHVVTLALNGLNRSMGHPDAYPFAVCPRASEKLEFVHRTIRDQRQPPTGSRGARPARGHR